MPNFHHFKLPNCTVILTSGELVCLLQKDVELYKKGLERGKHFLRSESLNARVEQKRSERF
jgi:hypothetical protein